MAEVLTEYLLVITQYEEHTQVGSKIFYNIPNNARKKSKISKSTSISIYYIMSISNGYSSFYLLISILFVTNKLLSTNYNTYQRMLVYWNSFNVMTGLNI